ncbi:hypothetical protein [Microcystis aeruginosa]|uniref:hypothetical protein n=1 Tax=Microcystis aeruginosa TaxID=1126 RepID=UPI0037CC239D
MCDATDRVIRDETLTEKDICPFLSIVFALERTNQLSLLSNKDLVDLCHLIEPYQVTKNLTDYCLLFTVYWTATPCLWQH